LLNVVDQRRDGADAFLVDDGPQRGDGLGVDIDSRDPETRLAEIQGDWVKFLCKLESRALEPRPAALAMRRRRADGSKPRPQRSPKAP
jgi:hypothetical protein